MTDIEIKYNNNVNINSTFNAVNLEETNDIELKSKYILHIYEEYGNEGITTEELYLIMSVYDSVYDLNMIDSDRSINDILININNTMDNFVYELIDGRVNFRNRIRPNIIEHIEPIGYGFNLRVMESIIKKCDLFNILKII